MTGGYRFQIGLPPWSKSNVNPTSPIDAVEATRRNGRLINTGTVNRLEALQRQIEKVHSTTVVASGVSPRRISCARIALSARGNAYLNFLGICRISCNSLDICLVFLGK